jgi:hypothetical protein
MAKHCERKIFEEQKCGYFRANSMTLPAEKLFKSQRHLDGG